MLTIPTSLSPSLTGTWRTRNCVISFITWAIVSSGEQTTTAFVISFETGAPANRYHARRERKRDHVRTDAVDGPAVAADSQALIHSDEVD